MKARLRSGHSLGVHPTMHSLQRLVALAATTLALLGCGKKGSGASGRDPVKLCEGLTAKGFVSACAPSTTPLDPALAGASQLVGFTASHEPGGSGQLAIFPTEAS